MKALILASLLGVPALAAMPGIALAQEETFSCKAAPAPVVDLEYGSRYTDDSKTRSDIDAESNAAVDEALKPVEKFINDLSKMANAAYLGKDQARVDCVTDWLFTWAEAGALKDLKTVNVQLSTPARFAGFALALLQADAAGTPDPAKRETIVAWLKALGEPMTAFFDEEAPTNASRNNLRAWAGLAAAAIGVAAQDEKLVAWGEDSIEMIICDADADGSLPLEMGRAERALNYQLHAVAPLVVASDLLAGQGFDGYAVCEGKLRQIVEFSWKAAKDPSLVEAINGKQQTFAKGEQKLEPFMMAWAEPYLAHVEDPELDAFVAPLREMSHSKLGGNMTEMQGWTATLSAPT